MVSNFVSATAPTYEVLLISRIVMGAVSGPLLAVATTYVPDLLGAHRSSIGISIIYAAFSIALVLATSAGRFIVEYLTWQVAMDAAFVFALVSAVLLTIFVPHASISAQRRLRAKALRSRPLRAKQAILFKEPPIIFGVLLFTFGVGAVYTFYGYVAPYLETYLGFPPAQSGLILLVFGIICIVSDLISGVVDVRARA